MFIAKCINTRSIGLLKFFSVEEDIRAYVIWGLGSFARVSGDQLEAKTMEFMDLLNEPAD